MSKLLCNSAFEGGFTVFRLQYIYCLHLWYGGSTDKCSEKIAALFAGAYSTCENGWTPSIDDTCLKVSSTTDTWHGAKSACQ